ncbi:MAG: MerR family transcriptional regulator [Rickettsiales bacterium]
MPPLADEKAPGALKTIREVAEILELPPHVLRFWETKFPQIQPLKRAGGRRFYRNEDVDALLIIRDLVHQKKYTIKGAQAALPKLLRDKKEGVKPVVSSFVPPALLPPAPAPQTSAGLSKGDISLLFALRDELHAMKRVLAS